MFDCGLNYTLPHFVLNDIIIHHLVIEGNRIFGYYVVRQLLLRNNNEWFAGLCSVTKPVVYGIPDTPKHFFMLNRRIFLSDQPWRGWAVSLHRDRVVEFSHHLVEFISVELGLWVSSQNARRIKHLRLRILCAAWLHQSGELFVQSLRCLLELLITEFVKGTCLGWSLLRLDRFRWISFCWRAFRLSSLGWRIDGIGSLWGRCTNLSSWTCWT